MATAILDKLLQSQWGKSFIMWVFVAMCAGISALAWWGFHQAKELKECNEERVAAERSFGSERERMIREQITVYQSMSTRLEAVEKKKIKR